MPDLIKGMSLKKLRSALLFRSCLRHDFSVHSAYIFLLLILKGKSSTFHTVGWGIFLWGMWVLDVGRGSLSCGSRSVVCFVCAFFFCLWLGLLSLFYGVLCWCPLFLMLPLWCYLMVPRRPVWSAVVVCGFNFYFFVFILDSFMSLSCGCI